MWLSNPLALNRLYAPKYGAKMCRRRHGRHRIRGGWENLSYDFDCGRGHFERQLTVFAAVVRGAADGAPRHGTLIAEWTVTREANSFPLLYLPVCEKGDFSSKSIVFHRPTFFIHDTCYQFSLN